MNNIESAKGEIVMYQPDETIRLEVRVENETVWLNRQQIAALFSRDIKTIGKHINNALREELDGESVGAKFATTYVTPTCAIALDVGSGTDVNYRDNFTHEVKLGNGPILTIASHANQILTRKIINSAKKLNINLQPAVEIARTYTDMDNIYLEEKGIPSQLISIPLRYMHSSVEVCSLKDVEEIIELLVDLIKNMDENDTFNPFEE